MNKPQLEEFMVFEDKNGKMGIILKNNSLNHPWWKCYKDVNSGGQVFSEGSEFHNSIVKLYKVPLEDKHSTHFRVLKFMVDGNLDYFECIYDENIQKEIEPVNIIINLTVNNPNNIDEFVKKLTKELEKVGCQI